MRALLGLLVGALLAPWQDTSSQKDDLRLWVGLDRDALVIERCSPWIAQGGPWADDGEVLALIARAYAGTGQEEHALDLLREAEPRTQAALVELEIVRTLLVLDRLQEAREALTRTSDGRRTLRHKDEPDAYLLYARIQTYLGDPRGVEEACARFLELVPQHPEASSAWHMRANVALKRGEGESATRFFEKARESEDWNALLHARRLQVLQSPDEPLPRLGLALVWMEAQRFDRGRVLLQELVRRHPELARGWFHLAEAERALGSSPLESYGHALALDPEYADTLYRRGSYLLAPTSERAEGSSAAERALGLVDLERLVSSKAEADPRFREAHWYLTSYWSEKDPAKAELHRARYAELGGVRPPE